MTDRPILYSGPMVRAIIADRKTQTRRLVKVGDTIAERDDGTPWPHYTTWAHGDDGSPWAPCPYGAPGDRLWVRETWRYHDWTEDGLPWIAYRADDSAALCEDVTPEWCDRVEAAWATLSDPRNTAIDGRARDRKWRPAIFMPRWASRLTLAVVSVRVERLQAITEEDAIAEGVLRTGGRANLDPHHFRPARDLFADLWDSINAKRAPWSRNPWVWVVEFTRVTEGSHAKRGGLVGLPLLDGASLMEFPR